MTPEQERRMWIAVHILTTAQNHLKSTDASSKKADDAVKYSFAMADKVLAFANQPPMQTTQMHLEPAPLPAH